MSTAAKFSFCHWPPPPGIAASPRCPRSSAAKPPPYKCASCRPPAGNQIVTLANLHFDTHTHTILYFTVSRQSSELSRSSFPCEMAPRNKSRVAKSTAGTRRTSRQVSLSVAAATATATASRELRPQQTNSSPSLGSNFAAVGRGILPSQFNSPLPPSRSLGHDVGGVFGNNHFDNDLFKTEYPMGGFSGHELLGNGLDSDDIDADGDEEFDLHPSLATNPNTPSQSFSNTPQTFMSSSQTQTTASVAQAAYPGQVKIESSLCKRLGQDPAMREPTQRRTDQKLNLERRSNVEALLAHVSGQAPARQCKNCHKGHGPWTECIVYEGQMCGSCTNCWYNASGSRCTFHGELP